MKIEPVAVAVRRVASLEEMETIDARPVLGSMCVRVGTGDEGRVVLDEEEE